MKRQIHALFVFLLCSFIFQTHEALAAGRGRVTVRQSQRVESVGPGINPIYLGIGYFSESSFYKQTQTSSSQASLLGTANYPLFLAYHYDLGDGSFLEPSFGYTLFGRNTAGNAATVTLWNLNVPYGGTYTLLGVSGFDWKFGPGLLHRSFQGGGGTVTLGNGTGTSTFAMPGSSSSSTTVSLLLGTAYVTTGNRFAIDLILEGYLTSKRTFNLMVSYAYAIF